MENEIELKNAKCTGLSLQVPICFDKGATKTSDFIIEAYTGEVVDRWWGKLAIAVSGIKAKKNIPIFRDHTRGNIVGYSDKTWKDDSFFVSGKFSEVTPHAAEVKALALEGFPWQASIGVKPLKILAIEDNATHEVNGKTLKGPAEVWLQSEVFETSFVPLGADGGTSISVFSKFEEAEQPTLAGQPAESEEIMGGKKETPVALTIEILRADHKDIVMELLAEGAQAERDRIQAVEAQAMPGHEALIAQLKFDGKTTGPEAAVQVLQAERTVRDNVAQNMAADGQAPAAAVAPPDIETGGSAEDTSLSVDERAKATWDKDKAVRAEFSEDFDSYLAYCQASDKGLVRVLGGKKK